MDETTIDPIKRAEWIGHDAAVKSRRQSGWGMVGLGAFLFLVINPLGTALLHLMVGGAAGVAGIAFMVAGLWRVFRAGRTSDEAIERVRARRRRPTSNS